ncbi:hypothetical protein BGZ61DRAFT_309161, partial [Ilyonectria robusta]|uniref:uncharacterized protein n=1 Tax=Ilyonectria robusta TaxID=1079257 RepID=UPI001E8ED58B
AAHKSGVRLKSGSLASTSTLPVLRSILTIASCPRSAANESGVLPLWSSASTSTLPISKSNLIIASCPPSAANQSGVLPLSSL